MTKDEWKDFLKEIRDSIPNLKYREASVEAQARHRRAIDIYRSVLNLPFILLDNVDLECKITISDAITLCERKRGRLISRVRIRCESSELIDRIRDLESRGFEIHEDFPVKEMRDSLGSHQCIVLMYPEDDVGELRSMIKSRHRLTHKL